MYFKTLNITREDAIKEIIKHLDIVEDHEIEDILFILCGQRYQQDFALVEEYKNKINNYNIKKGLYKDD